MSILQILSLLFAIGLGNLYCATSACTSCISGYFLFGTSCMAICPTGYYQNSTSNQCAALASQDVFYINFFEFLEYNATSIGNFSHPQNLPFIDQGKASPIPTRERGFYFANTSTLNSTVP